MTAPEPGDRPPVPRPGTDRLERPPSARYRSGAVDDRPDMGARGGPAPLVGAVAIAVFGAGVLTSLGAILAMTTGLVFVSGLAGAGIGLVLAGSPGPRPSVARRSAVLAVLMVVAAAAGTWGIARAEGGVLGPIEYLWTVFGLLIPIQAGVAAIAAAWGAGAGPIRWRA